MASTTDSARGLRADGSVARPPLGSTRRKARHVLEHAPGVALYRDGKYLEAIDVLKQSLHRGDSGAGFDLIFLALCHFQLGNTTVAVDYFKEARGWHERNLSRLSPLWHEELSSFFAEAKAVGLP